MLSFRLYMKRVAISLVYLGVISSSAAATFQSNPSNGWSLSSDAGFYSPVAHGEDLQLSACNSRLSNNSSSFSICDLPSVDSFRLYWYRYEPTLGASLMALYDNAGTNTNPAASEGLAPVFSTGLNSFFPIQSSNYLIGLYLVAEANAVIDLPNGDQANLGSTISAFAWSNYFAITEAVPVSEPLAALILFPGLLMIARRQRQRKLTR